MIRFQKRNFDIFATTFLISNGLPYNKKELFERIKYVKQFYNKLGCIELDIMKDYIKI